MKPHSNSIEGTDHMISVTALALVSSMKVSQWKTGFILGTSRLHANVFLSKNIGCRKRKE